MPVIRCQKCSQAYDLPGVVAARLPSSIATCVVCGEWISGSKAAVLARLLDPDEIREIDLAPYRVPASRETFIAPPAQLDLTPGEPRTIRVIVRGATRTINSVFAIAAHPFWIGRRGCHVDIDDAGLSLRHCSISLRGRELVLRDASKSGTFLDGQQIEEAVIGDGGHIIRAGSALISVEPTDEMGKYVEPLGEPPADEPPSEPERESAGSEAPKRAVLVCVAGPLRGQEFDIPAAGLVVGREGDVRVADEYLSRRHFEVVPDADGSIRVRDLGSRNGTFLNTLPARNARVRNGDEIQAGTNRFRIEERA